VTLVVGRPGQPLRRRDLGASAPELAPWLLNKVLVHGERAGRVVEVEAYDGQADPASHAFRGRTPRNQVMFGRPGHLYVYFTYGMHWCANVVVGPEGVAGAVLLRALAPIGGLPAMRRARPAAKTERELCSGPAKLCQALGITGTLDGADLVTGDRRIVLVDDGTPPPHRPLCGPRVGISQGTERRWRWWVEGDPNVSRGTRGALRKGGAADQRAPATGAPANTERPATGAPANTEPPATGRSVRERAAADR